MSEKNFKPLSWAPEINVGIGRIRWLRTNLRLPTEEAAIRAVMELSQGKINQLDVRAVQTYGAPNYFWDSELQKWRTECSKAEGN